MEGKTKNSFTDGIGWNINKVQSAGPHHDCLCPSPRNVPLPLGRTARWRACYAELQQRQHLSRPGIASQSPCWRRLCAASAAAAPAAALGMVQQSTLGQ